MKRLRPVLLGVGLVSALPMAAAAQFSATPAIVRLGAAAGGSDAAIVQVRNEATAATHFRFYLGDYDQNEVGDFTFADFGTGRGSCAGRLTVFPDAALLEPGAIQEVRVRLDGGSHACWALLFVESGSVAEGQVRLAQRIGVRVVNAPAASAPDGEVVDVAVTASADSLHIEVLFANLGGVPVELKGVVEVRALANGERVRSAELGPLGVLPATRRRIPLSMTNGLPPGRYVVVPIIEFGAEFLAGGQAEFTQR